MKISRRDQMAEAVLKELRKLLKSEHRLYGYVTPYENGREIGHVFHLISLPPRNDFEMAFTFSEFRRSDDIVVYPGNFVSALRGPDKEGDAMYEAKRFFRTAAGAASFIVSELMKAFSKRKKVS